MSKFTLLLAVFVLSACLDDAVELVDVGQSDGGTSDVSNTDISPSDADLGVRAVGQECKVPSDCLFGDFSICVRDTNPAPSGGYCTLSCETANPDCPQNSTCVEIFDGGGEGTVCVATCDTSMDCRPKFDCAKKLGPDDPKICWPKNPK